MTKPDSLAPRNEKPTRLRRYTALGIIWIAGRLLRGDRNETGKSATATPVSSGKLPTGGQQSDGQPSGFTLPQALAATVALIVAILGALGITGDLLSRWVRNNPLPLVTLIILALAAVATAVLATGQLRRTSAFILVLLVILLGLVLLLGASSMSIREQPFVTLSSTTDTSGNVTITVEAKATSLRSDESLLVQVVGLRSLDTVDQRASLGTCEHNSLNPLPDDVRSVLPTTSPSPSISATRLGVGLPAVMGDLLLWSRVGPNATGASTATYKIDLPAGRYRGVCAWAPLSDRTGRFLTPADHRDSAAYLRIDPRPATPSATSSPRSSTPPGSG